MSSEQDAALATAVAALARGELVGFPTETVYGLGANAADPQAVARLYAAKGRPADHPVIVHIASPAWLGRWVREMPPAARRLADALWPGPLTLVLPRAADVLPAITGGQDTVAVRCPAHPLALALLEACAAAGIAGLVAPSANRFGRLSPTAAAPVREAFGSEVALVLDGGPCAVGIESTIVEVKGEDVRVLRPGMLSAEALEAVLGHPLAGADAAASRVSGALPAHYAPRTPLRLLDAADCVARAGALLAEGRRAAVLGTADTLAALPAGLATLLAPVTAGDYARLLYAGLRQLDTAGAAEILVERPPQGGDWQGINDRLTRAARSTAPG